MARIVYSGLINSIRGSIGGTTFQKNAYGYSVKNKANVIKPNTSRQNIMKVAMLGAIQQWSQIGDSNRSLWDTFASTYPIFSKHNPTSQLSGFNYFVKRNFFVRLLGGDVLDNPGGTPPTLPIFTPTITNTGGALTVLIDTASPDSSLRWYAYISYKVRSTKNFIGSFPKYIATALWSGTPTNITTAYTNVFGTVPETGDRVLFKIVFVTATGGMVYTTQEYVIIVG